MQSQQTSFHRENALKHVPLFGCLYNVKLSQVVILIRKFRIYNLQRFSLVSNSYRHRGVIYQFRFCYDLPRQISNVVSAIRNGKIVSKISHVSNQNRYILCKTCYDRDHTIRLHQALLESAITQILCGIFTKRKYHVCKSFSPFVNAILKHRKSGHDTFSGRTKGYSISHQPTYMHGEKRV